MTNRQVKRYNKLKRRQNLTETERQEFKKLYNMAKQHAMDKIYHSVLVETFGRDVSLAYTQYANDWRK